MTLAYTTGTINLVQGSPIVTGNGTGWATALIAGGVIYPDAVGNALPILSVDSNTQITTVKPWRGGTGSNVGYSIVRDTAYLQQVTANANALAAYLSELDNPSLGALAAIASTMSAGKVPRAVGGSSMEWMQVSDAAKALLDDADAPAMRTTLGGLFYKGGTNRNDTLTGAAADFNSIPGDGVWRLDRGGGQAVLNGPAANLESGLAYRCLHIGDSARGTQIAMGYVSGLLYMRTGDSGWGPWYILPTSRQTASLFAVGGNEDDLTGGDQVRLSIPFVATTNRIHAVAHWVFAVTANAALELYGTLRLWDATAGVIVDDRYGVYTASPSDNGLGYKGNSSVSLSYGSLTLGRNYALQLLLRKGAAIGPIYPRFMNLGGILF